MPNTMQLLPKLTASETMPLMWLVEINLTPIQAVMYLLARPFIDVLIKVRIYILVRLLSGSTLYAMGGQVDDELGGDYTAMGMDSGNLQKGLFGLGYAAGGMPRFLSGGGDGMSDSIKATINDQPARLADGEFVIPADRCCR